jgi:RHS repeat-associated protein
MILLMPDRTNNRWQVHKTLYVSATEMYPNAIMNEEEGVADPIDSSISPENLGGGDGVGPAATHSALAIVKQITGVSKSKSAGVLVVSGTDSDTESKIQNDFRDINGDGYPDVIGQSIQLTNSRGGLTTSVLNKNVLQTSSASGSGASASLSSGIVIGAEVSSRGSSVNANHVLKNNGAGVGLGINAGFFNSSDYTDSDLIDINGDGLPDYLKKTGQVDLNFGNHFAAQNSWGINSLKTSKTTTYSGGGGVSFFNGSVSAGFSISKNISKGVNSLIDINGDGLPDRIINGSTAYLNMGSGFSSTPVSLPVVYSESESISGGINLNATYCFYFLIPIIGTGPKFCISVGGNIGAGLNKETVQIMDFNGDGYPDMVKSDSESSMQVALSKVGKTNMLKQVKRPLGAVITLDYKTKNPGENVEIGNTYAMPFSKQVLTNAQIFDGYSGDGESVMRKSFEYYNGYKDRRERTFLGFGKVVTNELDSQGNKYRIHTVEYVQNAMTDSHLYSPGKDSRLRQYYFKKGLVKTTYSQDAFGRKITQTDYDYVFLNPVTFTGSNAGYTYSATSSSLSSYPEKKRVLPLVKKMTSRQYAYNGTDTQGLEKTMQSTFNKYDIFGNILSYTDLGETGTNETISVDIKYHQNLNSYIVSVPSEHKVVSPQQTRRSTTTIDTKGNVTLVRQYLDAANFAENKMEYDIYGNITAKTNPNPDGGAVNAASYKVNIEYDSKVKTYPVKITNSYNAIKQIAYNYHFGIPVEVTDPYGISLEYSYDAFGRLYMVTSPQVMAKYILVNNYSANLSGSSPAYVVTDKITAAAHPQWAAYSPYEQIQYSRFSSRFSDGLGRIIQEKTQLQRPESCNTGAAGYRFAVSGKVMYDEFGRVTKMSLPVEEQGCGSTVAAQMAVFSTPVMGTDTTTFTYDHRDRELYRQVSGIGALFETKYGFDKDCNNKNQFMTTQIMPEGNTTVVYTDAKGRTTSSKQIGNNTELCTVFSYGALGEVLSVTDTDNAQTTYTYDNFGRKTSVQHPDRGAGLFTYDYAGQLTEFQNQKLSDNNESIRYQYNFGRLMAVTLPTHIVKYEYNLGRVNVQIDLTGRQEFEYGNFGEVRKNKRWVNTPDGGISYFEMQYGYDLWGRTLFVEYPDQERVIYSYDEGGMLKSVKSEIDPAKPQEYYIKNIQYDHFGNRTKVVNGNDVETEYFYSHQNRLRLMTLRRPTEELFMQNRYSYNTNSNITKLESEVSLADDLDIGGVFTNKYRYDDFNRLEQSDGNWLGKREEHIYSLKMRYNRTHGIVTKQQIHVVTNLYTNVAEATENAYTGQYQYANTSQPHTVSSITKTIPGGGSQLVSLDYDANGNLIKENTSTGNSSFDRNLYWDEQDRLRAVIRGNKVDYYAYDALGERIIKVKGSANSLHVNGGYVDGIGGIDEMVLYPNGYVTMNQNVPTKHYYADNQRIASRIGDPDSMGTVQGTNAVQNGTGNAENTAFMQQEIDKLFSTMGEDVTMEAMAGEPDCESELYHVKKILYNLDPEHPCLLLILKLEEQKMNPCEILEELEKEECYDPCEEEFQFWLDYLEEHNKLDCREQLYELYLSGNTKCDAILKMKEKGCLEIIIEIEEDCYQEFMAQYEYCLWTGDEECAEYFLGLLGGREQFEYCDLIEIIKEDHFYFPDTNIPEYPPVFPPAEEPEVEPEEPVEEIDPVVPQPPVIPGTPYIEGKIWWYHSDHLGSSSYLTDVNGLPTHYYGYLPFGEIMVEHNNSNYDNVYKFNGKELDESTGYYYYGARYYDPAISIFLSVDPLAEKFPDYTPYNYTLNNPIMFIDPDGRSPIVPDKIITTISNSKVSNTRITRDVSMKMTLTVVNMTGSNLSSTMFRGGKGNVKLDNFKGWGESYTSGARAVYGGVDSAKDNIKNFEIDFVVVNSLDDIRKDDNVLLVVNNLKGGEYSGLNYGRVSAVEAKTISQGRFDHVAQHELGHSAGADHSQSGLMRSGGDSNNVSSVSRGEIIYNQAGYNKDGVYDNSKGNSQFKKTGKEISQEFIKKYVRD